MLIADFTESLPVINFTFARMLRFSISKEIFVPISMCLDHFAHTYKD